MIIVPSGKILEAKREILVPRGSLRGRFKIEAVQPDGRKRLLADWFDNLITNNGLEAIAAGNYLTTVCVGSGNAAPSNGDTALQTLVGQTSNLLSTSDSSQSTPPYFGSHTFTERFAVGVATGNLAEVGIGSSPTNLFSRALILDGLGSPTTITVLSTEALDVTYQIQNQVPTADITGSITITGVTYNYTLRASRALSANWQNNGSGEVAGGQQGICYNGAIAAVTSSPGGAQAANTSIVNSAYSAGSHQRDFTCFWDLGSGNLSGGITAFEGVLGTNVGRLGAFQVGLDAAIPKDASHTLTMVFRHTWARFP